MRSARISAQSRDGNKGTATAPYLHLHCGAHELLLACAPVLAIADCAERASRVHSHCSWRGERLPLLALSLWLGQPAAGRGQQITVQQPGGQRLLLEVDRIERLLELAPQRILPVSRPRGLLGELMDGVLVDGNRCLLRLRHPLPCLATELEEMALPPDG